MREKLVIDERNLKKVDDTVLVKIYNESFDRGYQQGFRQREKRRRGGVDIM